MHIEIVTDIKKYLRFLDVVYQGDIFFKNNKAGLMPIVCGKKRPYYNHSSQRMVAVKEEGKILCQAVLIQHEAEPQALMISFFEALPGCQRAVDFLLDYAKRYGKSFGCQKIIISLDGHCNNGVAFSKGGLDFPSFGESYNPPYYPDYFKGFHEIKFSSYWDHANHVRAAIKRDMAKIGHGTDELTLEYADFSRRGFEKTMKLYTDLNNEIFQEQRYYFQRSYDEDKDLFREMRLLLSPENLIFAKRGEEYAGFILWYPDFNELVSVGAGAGIPALIKYKYLHRFPKKIKVVEIGVISKYRRYGTILALFNQAIDKVFQKYSHVDKIISSWILEENEASKRITKRYMTLDYKGFVAYEKDI